MSYEKIILVGNLGQDPELRYLEDGTAVCTISVAVNKKRQDDKLTTWYRVSVWRGSAENVCKYLKKGSKVLVEGSNLRVSLYETKEGESAASLELTADRVVFLDGAPEGATNDKGKEKEVEDIPF